ncbi:S-adenosylmethionine mitochondrial carrier protein homolog [Neocloeon triangulifer]|uniref:S-adenosylmethionine mitochondrial carrier protein homolog n=1 Tax=Neocloeon triangulifer TaxID=2078957 RepID=UPI00286F3372|nr:S-adenosylmethionine mitochondrial carrier protein homolog [Neocloeon triangulifer]
MSSQDPTFIVSLLSGGAAGTAVDIALFPLDTLKTRLQSQAGFWKSGGFRGIYSGVGPAALGSAPNAAVFFCTYDTIKRLGLPLVSPQYAFLVHMSAASIGELAACIARVPVEVVKQRRQTTARHLSALTVAKQAVRKEGFRGLYRGFGSTISREVPFSIIQFSLWEAMKSKLARMKGVDQVDPALTSLCGAVAGGISAGLTTPLDVAKTRIMLADSQPTGSIFGVLKQVHSEKGIQGLFAGLVPRVMWISIGGAVFFGVYEFTKVSISNLS